ncbi:MAG: hypothetical protein COA96_17120 [SAR86 cluster bacterium]|uniref:BioF2-like acetyltransferase domain-containing protein n=1 Tax=SAR86 cluster bacterium TaxID=2030880 RepID=A0A2A5AFS2_9GAMM|nr:MAG: hypothetical protein COA96_17120 [SAR86 cluster bacterium]
MHAVIETTDSGFSEYWNKLYANDPVQNPLYMQGGRGHFGGHEKQSHFTDRSFLVMAADEPVFGCSLTMHVDDKGRNCMGYFGLEASTHVNRSSIVEPSNNFRPEAIRLLQQHIYQLIDEIQPHSLEYLDPVSCGIMSPVTQVLLQKGGVPVVEKAQVIDLSLSQRALYRNVAKSCRGLVEWGRRNLEIEVVTEPQFEKREETQGTQWQSSAAANSTNPARLAYEKLINEGNGFLVQGRYKGKLVSSSLFVHTDRTCNYVFGDVLPGSPDRPVLHALIWEAMVHSKKRNCSQFNLGRSPVSADSETPGLNSKLIAECFGGEAHARLKVTLGGR